MPAYADRVKFYEDEISLFTKYGIENQIESAFLREVRLPSGVSLLLTILKHLFPLMLIQAAQLKDEVLKIRFKYQS